MIFTAQLGTADSMPGHIVLGYWTMTIIAPDTQAVYAPLWLVEIVAA